VNLSDVGEGQPLSWKAILEETPVYSSGGDRVGAVHEVLGSDQQDIFHGIVVRHGLINGDVMIPADQVRQITDRRIDVSLGTERIRALSPHVEEESYRLGLVGLFRKKLGWVPDRREPE